MQYEFTINEIVAEMQTKTISINFAYDIDPASINESTIQLKKRGTTELVDYQAKVEGRVVKLVLINWPDPNQEYILRIEKLKNILGIELTNAVKKRIIFESSICSTINILSPSFNEKINDIYIKWEEVLQNPNQELINSYLIEISTEANFYNIVKSSYVQNKTEITFDSLELGQYFLRARVQKDESYGFWSETISFIVGEKKINNQSIDSIEPIYIKPIQLTCLPNNGETPESFIFEFDTPINSDFLDNIIVIRKDI